MIKISVCLQDKGATQLDTSTSHSSQLERLEISQPILFVPKETDVKLTSTVPHIMRCVMQNKLSTQIINSVSILSTFLNKAKIN